MLALLKAILGVVLRMLGLMVMMMDEGCLVSQNRKTGQDRAEVCKGVICNEPLLAHLVWQLGQS